MKHSSIIALLCALSMLASCEEFSDIINNGKNDNTEQPDEQEQPNEPDQLENPFFDDTLASYQRGIDELYWKLQTHHVYNVNGHLDEGAVQLTRALFACQEITTDACKIAWGNDAWCCAMNTNTWTDEENDAVFGIFFRSIQAISYCNEFLRQTTDDKLSSRGASAAVKAKVQEFCAEARMIRALCYWIMIDTFGNVPFITEDMEPSLDIPALSPRAEVYDFIVEELEDLASDSSALNTAQAKYPRMDKGSALGLLSRLYLNAEIYKGTPEWEKCKQTCERIFTLSYRLAPTYAELFRGDNGENPDARGEFLMTIPFDTYSIQSYGGTTFLTCASISELDIHEEGPLTGGESGWGGIRVSGEFVDKFFNITDANFETGEYTCADERGNLFYIKGRLGNGKFSTYEELYNYLYGWSYFKFNNIPHDQTKETYSPLNAFSSIDLPIIRLGEVYLTYAEACVRMCEGFTAQSKMDELAVRTGVPAITLPAQWDDAARDMFVAERARELLWESCRRTDLIRYGLYYSNEYLWPFKGGKTVEGQPFPEYMVIFPMPSEMIANNPDMLNLKAYYDALKSER